MKVNELISKLLTMNQESEVQLKICGAKDSAYTRAELEVEQQDDNCKISGWVASDDEQAFLPGD